MLVFLGPPSASLCCG